MSLSAASIAALALYAGVLAPLVWLAIFKRGLAVAAGYVGFVVAVAVYHTGVFEGASLAPTDSVVRVLGPVDEDRCRQIRDLMEQSSLRVDRSDPGAPRVVGPGADQFPPEVTEALVACSEAQGGDLQPPVPSEPSPAGID